MRMPKKTAQYGWECSKCADDSDSDDKSVELGVRQITLTVDSSNYSFISTFVF